MPCAAMRSTTDSIAARWAWSTTPFVGMIPSKVTPRRMTFQPWAAMRSRSTSLEPARLVRRHERRRLPHDVHAVEQHDPPVLVHHERAVALQLVRGHVGAGRAGGCTDEEAHDDGDEEDPHGPHSRGAPSA